MESTLQSLLSVIPTAVTSQLSSPRAVATAVGITDSSDTVGIAVTTATAGTVIHTLSLLFVIPITATTTYTVTRLMTVTAVGITGRAVCNIQTRSRLLIAGV